MKDRILIGTVALLAIVCIAICAMMWLSLQRSQKVNQELLGALTDLRQTSARPAASTERTELAVRLGAETDQGPPVPGATIALVGAAMNPTQSMTLERTTNGDGIAVFPPVLPGVYSLAIRTAGLYAGKSIVVTPGPERQIESFIRPTPLPEVPVALEINWPEELPRDGIFLHCEFWPVPSDVVHENMEWIVRRRLKLYLSASGQVSALEQLLHKDVRTEPSPIVKVKPLKDADVGKLRIGRYMLREIRVLELLTERSTRLNDARFRKLHWRDYPKETSGTLFEAKAGVENRWTIPLSERLVEDVLAQLDVNGSSD